MNILVIAGNAFSLTQSNGKTLRSFFINMDEVNISQIYFGTNENPSNDICQNYYKVTELDIFKSLINFTFTTKNSHPKNYVTKSIAEDDTNKILKVLKKYNKNINLLREFLWLPNTWNSIDFNLWIKNAKPDIIFTDVASNLFVHRVVRKVSSTYNIPYVTFFTDDYVINDISTNIFQKFHHLLVKRQYKRTVKDASFCFTIGDMMSYDYGKYFKRNFGTLVNSIDFSAFNVISPYKFNINKKNFIISFIGGLHLNRWKSIAKLVDHLNFISNDENFSIFINVFTEKKPNKEILDIFSQKQIQYCGSLDSSEVIDQINKSDYLLHVESFDKENRLYTKYSISTKIPEYIASKRPIIAFGPNEVASIDFLKINNFACVITDLDTTEVVREKLISFFKQDHTSQIDKNLSYAKDRFNSISVSKKLKNTFINILDNQSKK